MHESYDTVVMANLVHVVENPLECLREANRLLRCGGSLIALDFTGHGMSLSARTGLVVRYLKTWGRPPRYAQSSLSPDNLAYLVERSGFKVKDVELIGQGVKAAYVKGSKS